MECVAREIQKGGYATDPSYADKLMGVVKKYKLEQAPKQLTLLTLPSQGAATLGKVVNSIKVFEPLARPLITPVKLFLETAGKQLQPTSSSTSQTSTAQNLASASPLNFGQRNSASGGSRIASGVGSSSIFIRSSAARPVPLPQTSAGSAYRSSSPAPSVTRVSVVRPSAAATSSEGASASKSRGSVAIVSAPYIIPVATQTMSGSTPRVGTSSPSSISTVARSVVSSIASTARSVVSFFSGGSSRSSLSSSSSSRSSSTGGGSRSGRR